MEKVYGNYEKIEHENRMMKQPSAHQVRRRRQSEQFMKMFKQHKKLKEQDQL